MRSEQETVDAIERYADTVKRLCAVHLANRSDTDDIFQTVFLKYALSETSFESAEHEKAWLIRVTINACKDAARASSRRRSVPLDEVAEIAADAPEDHRDVLEAVLALPDKYRNVVYLHFYEGYTAPEIASLIGKNPNTVYTLLARSKKLLRKKLGGGEHEA